MDIVARELPRLNIQTCHVALYEKGKKVPPEWSRLVLAYTQKERWKLDVNGKRFLSKQLVPEEMLPKDDSYALAVMPLFFQEDQFGFVLFGIERNVPKIYETLRLQISNALKRASLLQERHRAEQDLAQSNRELEAFTYSVSHDLRAPLRGMEGFSQILLEEYSEKLGVQGQDYLNRIIKASKHMGQLIDDLLKLSRLTRSEMHFKKVDLSRLVESVMEEFKQMNVNRQVRWIRAENIFVQGDEALLKVMLRNLIDNACKFTSRKADARIEFGTKEKNGKTIFYIRDNGIGFDMKYADKLFEVFQRHHTEFEGTGIGLTTVERIVRRHGGCVWAEGSKDKGATFYFTLN
jgi:light-regulated signal transduction histidine kinase (bacteriophytochrome)